MNKKYFSYLSFFVLALVLGGLLSGCSLSPTDQSAGTVEETPVAAEPVVPVDQTPVPAVDAAPVITDAELDQEVKAMDTELDTVKMTGFEATNLTDKDLGL